MARHKTIVLAKQENPSTCPYPLVYIHLRARKTVPGDSESGWLWRRDAGGRMALITSGPKGPR